MPVQPAADDLAQAHYAWRQVTVAAAAALAARQWAAVDQAEIAASWAARLPIVVATTTSGQYAAAQTADSYAGAVLGQPWVEYAVVAAALAGTAADGRDLASLLYQPVVTALAAVRGGQPVRPALALAATQLDTMVRTEVADAGRTADQIAATTHGADGYVRLTVGQSCSRCVILAGRWYPYSTGFLRHPRCDCVMVPARAGDEPAQTPEGLYATMTAGQRSAAGWSQAEQRAIAAGADIAAVTNIHRGGLYVAGGRQFTREAAGRRPRITPRQIYLEAGDDRAEAIRLLKLHRYIR